MRLQITHETRYTYEQPARSIMQILRLTPRNHDGQHVVRWRIEPGAEGKLTSGSDHFGNIVHVFSADESVQDLAIVAVGEVETSDVAGIVRQAVERVPDGCYLRSTISTEADEAIRAFAEKQRDGAGRTLPTLHNLMEAVHGAIRFDRDPTSTSTTAAEAFALGLGVCQDLSHVFIAAARHLGIPARYVSGYVLPPEGVVMQQAGHAWAEGLVPDLGWVGFDPTHLTCPTPSHVRVAIGLDSSEAAPIRGSRRGGGGETMAVRLTVEPAPGGQYQRQE
ncbi:transglutaminase family protein [Enterovirga rhinocerotis]|uniref:Transglutaminase-like putative cysteine protease n=1 Tax=Enterovirga rhinocerotis TaxID=1339210 RepID=A0A4R7BXP7_9HYPH|nr:transglutaminase family protein [Enterovirga rhinocerotis]TDR88977.1 transglutaminase-like putative cysteine protease [Enterovirga rhinocerotis]